MIYVATMTNDTDREHIKTLVLAELDQISNPVLKEALSAFLVEPVLQSRKWDYSVTGEMLPCWIVADFKKGNMGLAYSSRGHGERGDCWGIVLLSDNRFGRDDSWFLRLEDAFINSGFWDGPLPENYEIP